MPGRKMRFSYPVDLTMAPDDGRPPVCCTN